MASNVPNKCNLIINYLPQSLTDEEFHNLFESVGKTTYTRIIRDKMSNYSFGYGFVNYEKEEDAAKAIEQLNGQSLQHKTLKVAYSHPSGHQTKNINLHVSGLPPDATEDALAKQGEPYGTVVQCRIVRDKSTGKSQGFGFLLYSNRDEALAAIRGLHGSLFPGTEDNVLTVKFARTEQKAVPDSYLRKQYARQSYGNGSYDASGYTRAPYYHSSYQERYSPMGSHSSPYYPTSYPTDYTADAYYGGAGDFRYQGSHPSEQNEETIVFVYGIGSRADEDCLWHLFSPFGNILRVNVMWNHVKNQGKGFGFVTFSTPTEASLAIQHMHGTTYQGRELQVKFKSNAVSSS